MLVPPDENILRFHDCNIKLRINLSVLKLLLMENESNSQLLTLKRSLYE